jgi:hypothetical protein
MQNKDRLLEELTGSLVAFLRERLPSLERI